MTILTHLDQVQPILSSARTIAVLGAHHNPTRPAYYVPDYLASVGYRIIPVNPTIAGSELWGERVRATLTEIEDHVDLVDVFRNPVALPGHVDEILAMASRPEVVWLQPGARNDAVAQRLNAAGIDVVVDRCTYADHRRMQRTGQLSPPRAAMR